MGTDGSSEGTTAAMLKTDINIAMSNSLKVTYQRTAVRGAWFELTCVALARYVMWRREKDGDPSAILVGRITEQIRTRLGYVEECILCIPAKSKTSTLKQPVDSLDRFEEWRAIVKHDWARSDQRGKTTLTDSLGRAGCRSNSDRNPLFIACSRTK